MCFGSSEERRGNAQPNRPVTRPPARGRANIGGSNQHAPSSRPQRTRLPMNPAIRREFLDALHRAMGALDYAVIGGSALAEYGHTRATADVDIMVPAAISEVTQSQLVENGIVQTEGGGLGYIASDGRCYGLDITSDRDVSQHLRGRGDTTQLPGFRARILNMPELLNSKAWSWMTRIGPDAEEKLNNDAQDIFFILNYIIQNQIRVDRRHCRWVVDYDFWTEFTRQYQGTEGMFQQIGLMRDPTPDPSNQEARSRYSRSSSNSGTRAGSSNQGAGSRHSGSPSSSGRRAGQETDSRHSRSSGSSGRRAGGGRPR